MLGDRGTHLMKGCGGFCGKHYNLTVGTTNVFSRLGKTYRKGEE